VTRRARSRAGERGFTLVEVLVSLAVLSIVGAVMGVVFSVGMRAILAPGASQDRLAASSDAITVEQLLSEDVDRASCIHFPNAPQDSGSCDGSSLPFQGQCGRGADLLCIGWPDLANLGQCDMSLYALSANPISRTEWQGSAEATKTYPGVVVTILSTSASPLGLDVSVISDGPRPADPPASPLANPPSLTLDLQSLAADQWPTLTPAPSGAVSTSPC